LAVQGEAAWLEETDKALKQSALLVKGNTQKLDRAKGQAFTLDSG
jgi:hypothetical protein